MNDIAQSLDQARSLRREGRHAEAAQALESLVRAHGPHPLLCLELGNALRAAGRLQLAIGPLAEAARLAPREPATWLNLGITHLDMDRPEAALESFRQALALVPSMPEAHNVAACALLSLGRSSEARNHLTTALRQRPDYAAAHDNLGRCLRSQGHMEQALQSFARAQEIHPNASTGSNALLALLYVAGLTNEEIGYRHRQWADRYADHLRPASPSQPASKAHNSRIRIGYVSSDFRQHSLSFFIAPILANHDKSRFEITCYSSTRAPDNTTQRLRALSENWHDIAGMNDEEACRLIREHEIDILVDLSGHSAGNRLLLFARRPAPVQISWLGYPATTGMQAMDYRISDSLCIPPGTEASQGCEKILRLPDIFTCYEAPSDAPPVTGLPPRSHGHPPVFCSFNNLAKLSEATLATWARLLRALPGASLLIKSPGADEPASQERINSIMRQCGVREDRLQYHGRPLPLRAHLSLYGDCHVALDPFPYNGTTTTCEALLMGVPIITLAGNSHVSRVGVSLLKAVGLESCVANDTNEYVELAATLATDLPRLAGIRANLRDHMLKSPLCNAQLFTHRLESSLIELHRADT